MKIKYILISAFIIILTFISCTVNETTGLIKVENHTTSEIKNVRVGKTLIVSSVAPGSDYYYWYFNTISGEVSSDNMDAFTGFAGELEFEVGYWITIAAELIITQDGEEAYLTIDERKHGP